MNRASLKSVKKITFLYVFIAGLWIAFSDRALLHIAPEANEYAYVQTFKGIFFIIASGALIYWLLYKEMRRIDSLSAKILDAERKALEAAEAATEEKKRLYEEALFQKNFFEQIFTQSSSAMQILDKDGLCERVNPKFYEIYNVEPGDVEYKFNINTDPEAGDRGIADMLNRVYNEGVAVEIETEYDLSRAKKFIGLEPTSYSPIWLYLKAYPIKGRNGEIDKIVILSENITERKRYFQAMNESIALYTAIARNIPNGTIMLFDRDFRYTFTAGAGFGLVNMDPDFYIGKTLQDVAPKESVMELAGMYSDAFRGKTSYGEFEYLSRNFSVTIAPIKSASGDIEMGMLLTQDITLRKQYEKELSTINADLEKRVSERTLQLENTATELEFEIEEHKKTEEQLMLVQQELAQKLEREKELHTIKSRFVSMVSHEYRAPLTIIQTSAYLLREYMKRNKPESVETQINRIEAASNSMVKLLEDVLTIGRSEDVKSLEYSKLELVKFSRDVALDIKESHNSDIEFEFISNNPEMYLPAHELSLRQIMINLISNAIKYSPAGSKITVSLYDNADHVEISVIDRGIGIPEKDLNRLCEPFHRAENVGARPGTGLGLAIVQKCVKLLRGSIKIHSREGEGSNFTVYLPKDIEL